MFYFSEICALYLILQFRNAVLYSFYVCDVMVSLFYLCTIAYNRIKTTSIALHFVTISKHVGSAV